MTQMQRREFLTTVAGAAATAPFIAKAKTKNRGYLPPIPQVTLGNTGISTSRMAQGTGFVTDASPTRPERDSRISWS